MSGVSLPEAIRSGSLTYVRHALAEGADPSKGKPLWEAARCINLYQSGNFVPIVQELIKAGTSKTDRDAAVQTLLSKRNQYFHSIHTSELNNIDRAVALIVAAQTTSAATVRTVPVAKSTVRIYETLLFSAEFSDVKFVFSADGSVLHAHRCVLAAASDYFHSMFQTRWADHHPDGVWECSNSKEIMKVVLTFIYTGKLDPSVLEAQIGEVLSVTDQYGLKALQAVAEQSVLATLSLKNVKSSLLLADLHHADTLKAGCFSYIRRNAAQALLDPSVTSLSQEKPELWAELVTAVRGS